MSKHTKGPWKLHRINSDTVFVTEDRLARGEAIPAYNRKLVEMPHWSDENYDEKIANARLIAAAPELLEACQALVYAHENAPFGGKSEAFNKALAAIAKAEGDSSD